MRQTTDPTQTKCSDCSGGSACATELEFLGCAIYFWTRAKNTDLRIWILIRFGGLGTQCCSFAEVHSLWAEVGDKRCTLSLSPSTTGRNILIFSFFLFVLIVVPAVAVFIYIFSIFCFYFLFMFFQLPMQQHMGALHFWRTATRFSFSALSLPTPLVVCRTEFSPS